MRLISILNIFEENLVSVLQRCCEVLGFYLAIKVSLLVSIMRNMKYQKLEN